MMINRTGDECKVTTGPDIAEVEMLKDPRKSDLSASGSCNIVASYCTVCVNKVVNKL